MILSKEKVANYLMLFFISIEILFLIYLNVEDRVMYNGIINIRSFSMAVILNILVIINSRHSVREKDFKSFVIIQLLFIIAIVGAWFVYKPQYTFNEAKQIVETDYNKKYLVEELSERNIAISYYYIIELSNKNKNTYYYLFHPLDGVYKKMQYIRR